MPPKRQEIPIRSTSLADTIINAYSLRELLGAYEARLKGIVEGEGDVRFSTPTEGVSTHRALFSVAAAARGRPGIPVERFGRGKGMGGILRDEGGEGEVKCFDEGFVGVKRVYGHIVHQTGEQMDRLLEVVIKGGEDVAAGDFKIELEDEDGGGRKVKRGNTEGEFAEVTVHRFVLVASVGYYRYLSSGFGDSGAGVSRLPFPTVTFYALRVLQRWLYNPLRIGEVMEEFEPGGYAYLLVNCKRGDRSGHAPPVRMARGVIEIARAADYLGIEEVGKWCTGLLRKMCHGLRKCGGGGCRVMIPFILDEIYKNGGALGLDEKFDGEVKEFLARNVEGMWKRPVIMMDDAVLGELVRVFKGMHAHCGAPASGGIYHSAIVRAKKKGEEEVETRPLHWWNLYLELNRVRVSVVTSASGNRARWMEKLLGPTMEHCVHEIARGFNDVRLAADLGSKLEDGSFQKDLVEEMLGMVCTSSIFGGVEGQGIGIPFEKPPLNRRTVKAVFEGVVNLRKFTREGKADEEWVKAERKVIEFLAREWMTIVVGGEGKNGKSGFASWRPAMLTVLEKKLKVPVEDLLGQGGRKGMPAAISAVPKKKGRIVKDKFGNDVVVDSRELQRTEIGIHEEEEAGEGSASNSLRPETEAFVPTGGVLGVDGAAD
ncbi:hypothetical protein TWF481_000991 [Arthrobotrys musiformis]|uniref:Uncharacterized protein n=1 Tax=Arthrobotrys musiformis TaxID=47236 RepID=A0AAV9WQ92_9PEZI